MHYADASLLPSPQKAAHKQSPHKPDAPFVCVTRRDTPRSIRRGIGLMLIIAPAITAKSFGRWMPAKLITALISSDCPLLLVMKSSHIAFFYFSCYFAISIKAAKVVRIKIQSVLSTTFSDSTSSISDQRPV